METCEQPACDQVQKKCIGCNTPNSESACSRCSAPYCSRECQVKHWPVHKQRCINPEQTAADRQRLINQLFDRVCKIIAGNVIILSAWYKNERGCIEIEITEGLVDFSQSGTHFLHMNYIDMDASVYDKYSEPDKCIVKFKLSDFEFESTITVKIPAVTIKARQPQPSRELTLMYEV